ncbi:MAG: hypothetical protein ABH851_09045 [Methanobacteriota archaeon]
MALKQVEEPSKLAQIHPEPYVQKAFAGLPLRDELLRPLFGRSAVREDGNDIVNFPRCGASSEILSYCNHIGQVRQMFICIELPQRDGELPNEVEARLAVFNELVNRNDPDNVTTHGRIGTNTHEESFMELKIQRLDGLTRDDKTALVAAANDIYDILNPGT